MSEETTNLIIKNNPQLDNSREKLEAMKPGSYCIHRSWGFGQIKSYDTDSNKLLIDFEEGKQDHPMDPSFCIDKLIILEPSNLLVRQKTEPKVIEDMLKNKQTDIVVEILNDCTEHKASSAELERLFSQLIGPVKFKKWWTATKKLLEKDPRVCTPKKKSDPYSLHEEPISPEQEILDQFYESRRPSDKILLAEKLYKLSSNASEIEEVLPKVLEELTEALQNSDKLTEAERLQGVWIRNDLARYLSEDVDTLEPTSASLLQASPSMPVLAMEVQPTYYSRLLDLIKRTFTENEQWKEICLDVLKSSSGKLTNECIQFLIEHGSEELVKSRLEKWLTEQLLTEPVLSWIIKNRQSKKFNDIIKDLIQPRLLHAIFYAIDMEALQSNSSKRIPLADLLSDDKTLIADLIKDASKEIAHDLANSLMMNQGFENLTKKSLLARFIKLFPSIQVIASGEQSAEAPEAEDLIVSKESMEIRKREYEILVNKKIPENKEAIAVAREHGDLKENSEYKMARQDQDTLMAQKALWESELTRARVSDFTEAPTDVVSIGSVVDVIEGSSGKSHRFSILGAWDSNPENNVLSYKTPLSKSLLGKKVGDSVKTNIGNNEEEWSIKAISRWVDLQK